VMTSKHNWPSLQSSDVSMTVSLLDFFDRVRAFSPTKL
jgi:hypothetical protein